MSLLWKKEYQNNLLQGAKAFKFYFMEKFATFALYYTCKRLYIMYGWVLNYCMLSFWQHTTAERQPPVLFSSLVFLLLLLRGLLEKALQLEVATPVLLFKQMFIVLLFGLDNFHAFKTKHLLY